MGMHLRIVRGTPTGIPTSAEWTLEDWYADNFRLHYAPLCQFVSSFVESPDTAEDIVQDLFVSVWERHEYWLAAGEAIRPMLFKAARNRALNLLKRRGLERRTEPLLGLEDREPRGADLALREEEISAGLRDAVATLPERCRLIFTLSRDGGLTYAQIADVLHLSVKTVETQMGRALRALRDRLAVHLAASLVVTVLTSSGL